jgi:hypothetical protein
MKFRKKPVVIDAFLAGSAGYPDWFKEKVAAGEIIVHEGGEIFAEIRTLEGVMNAERGDYIIKGVKNEVYPCKPDIFEATYEAA